jgi:hypothetical protein
VSRVFKERYDVCASTSANGRVYQGLTVFIGAALSCDGNHGHDGADKGDHSDHAKKDAPVNHILQEPDKDWLSKKNGQQEARREKSEKREERRERRERREEREKREEQDRHMYRQTQTDTDNTDTDRHRQTDRQTQTTYL